MALAISTAEAKYVSAGKAFQQALWVTQAIVDYDIQLNIIRILCDNKGAIDLTPPKTTTVTLLTTCLKSATPKACQKGKKYIYMELEKRLFHEGRVIHPIFLANTNIVATFLAINFQCLLTISEPICTRFVIEFYRIEISKEEDISISICFKIEGRDFVFPLPLFVEILNFSRYGACLYTYT
ncbi:hypothetical protein Tco_0977721 [Tanacetum coccineum]|uniref:Uncharacterized protein n=1 Tax=Tanacetum coccineum TaxID=301880 RepID=A0ABQ5EL04_9ASTR